MEKKRYKTAGRVTLLAYLKDTVRDSAESAEEIYRGLEAAGNAPGRSSVYRMLSELCDSGEVRKFRADAEGEGYVYQYVGKNGGCEGHFHLQCVSCGKIAHLKCGCGEEIRIRLLNAHGFAVDSGHTVLYGTCAACRNGGIL